MANSPLTKKQETALFAYLEGATKSDAYRVGYNTKNMKAETVNRAAKTLFDTPIISARIEQERSKFYKRNRASLDEILYIMASAARLDPLDFLNEDGSLKPMKDIPKATRQAVAAFEVQELFASSGLGPFKIGELKKIKFVNKAAVFDMFMKYFGAYLDKDALPPADSRPILEGGRELPGSTK